MCKHLPKETPPEASDSPTMRSHRGRGPTCNVWTPSSPCSPQPPGGFSPCLYRQAIPTFRPGLPRPAHPGAPDRMPAPSPLPPAWRCQQPVNVGTADVRARAPPGKRCCYGKEFLICRISGEDIKVKGGRWGGRQKRPLGSRLGSRAASRPVLGVKTETPPRECSPCQVPLRLRDLV